jgi:hypothetical protein
MGTGRRFLIPGLVAGALLRVAALALPGTSDLDVWKAWSFGAAHDLTGVYGVGGSPPIRRFLHWEGTEMTVDYPPVAVGELAVVGRLYGVRHPRFEDSSAFTVMVKLPGIAAEVVMVIAILTYGRRRYGETVASWTALAFWLNPAVVLDGSVLGYLDAQMAVPAALAAGAAVSGWPALAAALLFIAVLTKAQALFVAPAVLAIVIWNPVVDRRRAIARAATGGLSVGAIVFVPYIVRGASANLMQGVGRLATQDMLSAYATNVWWIFTWVLRVRDVWHEWGPARALTQQVRILAISRAIALGYPNPRVLGLALVAIAIALAVWRLRTAKSDAQRFALAGWCACAYALLAAQVHENHLFLAVPFFVLAAGLERRYRGVMWAISAIVFLNLLLFYGLGWGMPSLIRRSWTGIDASVILALANIGVFVLATRRSFASPQRALQLKLPASSVLPVPE